MTTKPLPFHFSELTDMFEFLDALRRGGTVNMFGAYPHVAMEYGISDEQAKAVFLAWGETITIKGDAEDRAKAALAK